MKKIYCCCCGRQLVSYETASNDKHIVCSKGAKAGFPGTAFCRDCGADLDENGLFPEERAEEDSLFDSRCHNTKGGVK